MIIKILTLEGETERQNHMRRECKKINATPDFFYGVRGSTLSEEERRRAMIGPDILTPGEIGCALSHLQLYQYMIDEDIPYLMIVEDDVIFTPELVTLLPKIEDFVIHHLQGTPATIHLHSPFQYLHEAFRLNDRISLYSTQHTVGAFCYIMTKEAAANVLKIQTPLRWQIDIWKFYCYLGALKLFAPNEDLICVAENIPSIITSMGGRIYNKKIKSRQKNSFYHTCARTRKGIGSWHFTCIASCERSSSPILIQNPCTGDRDTLCTSLA